MNQSLWVHETSVSWALYQGLLSRGFPLWKCNFGEVDFGIQL
jgi:hypothetical protein